MPANHTEASISGAALAPLGNREKRELAILSRRAWEKLGRPGESFDAWRHQQCMLCCERSGLRQARHEDYNYIRAHMLRILGAERQARQAIVRAGSEPRRQALAKLQAECRNARYIAKPVDYVKAIAKSKFKTTLISSELSANQIWQLIYSLRNAENRHKRKAA